MKWEKVEFNDVLEKIVGGGTPSKTVSDYWNGDIPWCSVKDMVGDKYQLYSTEDTITHSGLENSSSNLIPAGTVITSTRMGLGRAFINKVDMAINQDLKALIPNERINNKFLLWTIINKREEIEGLGIGSTVKGIRLEVLRGLKFNLPPLPIQRKIASILSAYDDLIENNLKRIKLLEEKAFASYKLLVKSEKLIEGKVGDLADVKSGYAFKSRDWSDEGFPVIKIKNIGNNDIELTDCSFIPENIAEAANKFKLNAGDLLIAMTGATVGKIGMMPKTETSFYLNQRVGIFKPKIENAELFLFCFFNEPTAKNAVESLASGAAQPNISGSQLESIKLYYPKLETITEFGISIKSHFELIWNLKEQNTKLREARDILLPKLMNGQIEV